MKTAKKLKQQIQNQTPGVQQHGIAHLAELNVPFLPGILANPSCNLFFFGCFAPLREKQLSRRGATHAAGNDASLDKDRITE
jgi:hypothetical protein